MAEPLTIALWIGGTLLVAGVAIAFWEQIVAWAHDSLFPWFEANLPMLAPHVRKAFAHIDKTVRTVRKAFIAAWRTVRPHLLKLVETFERTTDNKYILRVTSYLREKLKEDAVIKRETEQELTLDELPDDVIEAMLSHGSRQFEVNVKQRQDQLVDELELELAT